MRKRRVVSLLSALAMAVSVFGTSVSAATFPDVKSGDWYYGYVTDVSEKGLITGYADGRFGATDNLTRGQFATILHRMEESPEVTFSGAFPDVKDGVFYSDPAEWANREGLITGYADGKYGPVDNLTREQLATIMYRYAKWEGADVSAEGSLSKFPDGSKVSGFATDAMEWAVGEGIISGNADGTLAPQGTVSRAVAATIISRYTSDEGVQNPDDGNEDTQKPDDGNNNENQNPGSGSEDTQKPDDSTQNPGIENEDTQKPDDGSGSTPEVHVHDWKEVTVLEPVYGPMYVVHCDQCGEEITGRADEHFDESAEKYYNGEITIDELCLSKTVTFTGEEGINGYRPVVVGYECECGATK